MKYTTTNREGYREYKSDPHVCEHCPCRENCTLSKNKTKVVTRHVWAKYLEEAEHLRHVPKVRDTYKKRKETIERVFADAKERHCLRYTNYRGLAKVKVQVALIFSCLNLKKLAIRKLKDLIFLFFLRRPPTKLKQKARLRLLRNGLCLQAETSLTYVNDAFGISQRVLQEILL